MTMVLRRSVSVVGLLIVWFSSPAAGRRDAHLQQGRRAGLLQELRRAPSARRGDADVAHVARHGEAMGPRLTQQEIDTIAAWVDAGAPKGAEADLLKPPTFATGWLHPNGTPPDAIIEAPVEVKWDGSDQVPWTTYYMPVPFAEDKFVEATQVKPSNLPFVHHTVVHELITRTVGDMHIVEGKQVLNDERGRQALPNIPAYEENLLRRCRPGSRVPSQARRHCSRQSRILSGRLNPYRSRR